MTGVRCCENMKKAFVSFSEVVKSASSDWVSSEGSHDPCILDDGNSAVAWGIGAGGQACRRRISPSYK